MLETLKNAWKVAEIRKKLLYTLFMLLVFRLLCFIPTPGVTDSLLENIRTTIDNYSLLGFMQSMTGSDLASYNIMAMGITPYINSSIIMQLLCVAIPKLEELQKQGDEGRKKIAQITRYVTVGLGFVQAVAMTVAMGRGVDDMSFMNYLTIGFCLAAGTALAMWIGERITENGIGNGISLLIFAGIISNMASYLLVSGEGLISGNVGGTLPSLIASVLIFVVLIIGIVFVDLGERRIPIQYSKRMVGRKMYGGQSTHLPIKVNASGVMPIIFASSILSLPQTVSMFWQPAAGTVGWHVLNLFSQSNPFYIIVYGLLILAFAYFYASIQFNPIEISNNLKKNGGFIPGFRPGKPTSDFITKALGKVTFVGAIFLGIVAILPLIVGAISPNLSNVALGGTSVIIVVGVALDTVKQLEAQMLMRHHKGFLE